MKRTYSFLAISQLLLIGSILHSCEVSSGDFDLVQDNKAYLNAMDKKLNGETNNFTNSEEWLIFRWENEQKIVTNQEKIEELKDRFDKVGKPIDDKSKQLFIILNDKNIYLKKSLETYEGNQSDWKSFKHQYNFEMKDFEMRLKVLLDDRSYILL
jgi:hypothetical protein